MAKRGGGSGGGGGGSVLLVVFLVFFILLSIGLGVATYMGFSQDDDKAGQLVKEKEKEKELEKERDWYRFQALLYRADMGHTQNLDYERLANNRENFDKGILTGKEKPEVKAIVDTLDKKLEWDAAQKRPKLSYEKLVAEEKRLREAAEAASKGFQVAEAAAKEEVRKLNEQLETAITAHKKELDTFVQSANSDLAKEREKVNALTAQMDALGATFAVQAKAGDEDKTRIQKQMLDLTKANATLRNQLKLKDDAIALLRSELGRDVPAQVKMAWKIERIDQRGDNVSINLGSADKVQPQLTFRVHGVTTDGRPQPKDKALVEVVDVIGPHLSRAKVTYVTTPAEAPRHDPRHNPVLPGDVLINPSWDPNQKKHIALAGLVDLTGDGRDDTEQFMRALERQNVVVDAYLDLKKDFTIKGPGISVQTDYLIVGETPKLVLGAAAEKDIRELIDAGMEEMRKQARDNGVRVRNLRQYLEEIGYRIPGSASEQAPAIEFKGNPADLPKPVPKNPMQPQPPMGDKPPPGGDKPLPVPMIGG